MTIVSAEPVLPYQRAPLSKTYLAGDKGIHDILIRQQNFYEQQSIQTQLGVRVSKIDRSLKKLILSDGAEMHYSKLALTTGAQVRKLPIPGSELAGVHYLRDMHDVDNIRRFVGPGKKAVIVGGGYIGLETAAALRKLDMDVTVLEAQERVLQRVTAPEVSAFYTRIHGEEGVNILVNTVIESVVGDKHAEGVVCTNGTTLPADLVIIGVGVLPVTQLAEDAGLETDNGIVVDEYARTNDPDIVAAGDCTNHYNPIYKRRLRLESVQNAADQAKVAAATICGKLEAYNALPWFWSDQYDLKLQIAGLSQGFDQVVVRGDISGSRSFSAFYLKDGQLIAVDAVNSPKEFMLSKRAITNGFTPDLEKLVDSRCAIQEIFKH
ncbi:NAD(P)/FAD-dependent oxidoreductase [Pseudomaricurvus alcaniphilus]|uniref:NAD(P)/FAD-dependent oxidoreductase n=1 Tax=Pseudomaricurvus alcaniphilus TaxID=1166482 RepID=UPI00313324EF